MKRHHKILAVVLSVLVSALLMTESRAQTSMFNGFYLVDKEGNEVASGGKIGVNVDHISTAVHVAGINSTVQVDCIAGCSASSSTHTAVTQAAQPWTVAHIAAAVHVVVSGRPGVAAHQAGTWAVDVSGGTIAISGGTVSLQGHVATTQAGTWTIAAAQSGNWTIAHVTSVTHVLGNMTLRSVAGTAVTVTGTALDVNCTGCSAAAAVNVGHISAVVHVAGALQIGDMTCPTCRARVDHYNVLVVQPHISGAFRAWRVASCGTTATQMISTNPNRRDLYIQNLGGPTVSAGAHSNVYLGFGTTGHVALTINNGWVLHSMSRSITPATTSDTARVMTGAGDTSRLILYNYAGPVSCISATTGPLGATLTILEILR